MTTPAHPAASDSPDLEKTAELPAPNWAARETPHVTRELSGTDTWVAPAPADLEPPEQARSGRNEAMESAQALGRELADTRSRLARTGADLADAQGQLADMRTQLADTRGELAGSRAELTDARVQLAGSRAELEAARAAIDALTRRLETSAANASAAAARDLTLEALLAERDRALVVAEQRLAELKQQRAAHLEALQSVEGRRGVLDALLRGLHGEVSQRDSRVAELEAQIRAKDVLLDGIHSAPPPNGIASVTNSLAMNGSAPNPSAPNPPDVNPPADGVIRRLVRQDGSAKVHILGRKTRIGRTPDNDVQIDAKLVSRHHAMIFSGPGQTIIEDLNSTNGVLVNGRRVVREQLQDGDEIVLGRTHFRFELGGIR